MISLAIVCVLSGTASAAEPASVVTTVTADAGEPVTLEPPSGIETEGAYWVELSGPGILLRKGEAPGPELRLRPRVRGRYRFACLSDEEGPLAEAKTVELSVAGRPGRKERPIAVIRGPLRGGAREETELRGGVFGAEQASVLAARWKQLSGPRLELRARESSPRASVRFTPSEPGRYRFALKVACERGRTPWATFTFEVPRRADGSADHRPVARVTSVARATVGGEVVLDGSASFDPDGDDISYEWDKLSAPAGLHRDGAASAAQAGEVAVEGARVKILPALPGRYSFALTVTDPYGLASEPDRVAVEVAPRPGPPAAHPDAPDPLDRPFSVLLDDAPLSALFSRLSDREVTVRTAADLGNPVDLAARRIDLWVVDLPARRVLDWLGRMLGASYLVEGPGSVWFTRGTRWLEREERVAETYRIDGLYSEEGASDLVGMLREAVRAALWAGAGVSLADPDLEKGTLYVILPRSAQARVSDVVDELRRHVPSGPPAADDFRRVEPEEDAGLSRLLSVEVDGDYEDWTVRDVAWDLARQARVTIAFDSTGGQGARKVTLRLGRVGLSEALGALAREAGFTGYVIEPVSASGTLTAARPRNESSASPYSLALARGPREREASAAESGTSPEARRSLGIWAVWLCEGPPPPRTSQCMWQAAEIRSYDVRVLEARHGFSGSMLVHMVRGRVFPDRWDDPFVMVAYSPARKRLVVIHHEEVQRAVAALLDRLVREGQEALED